MSRADFGNILRPEPEGRFYRPVAYHGDVSQAYLDLVSKTEYRPDRGSMIGRTLRAKAPVQIVDVLQDTEYTAWDIQQAGGYRTMLGIPMLRNDDMIGLFVVVRLQPEPFTDDQIALLPLSPTRPSWLSTASDSCKQRRGHRSRLSVPSGRAAFAGRLRQGWHAV